VLVLAGVAELFGAGCSDPNVATASIGKTYPVSGKVVLSNGKPLTAGRVVLVPEELTGAPSSGEITTDGQFHLTTKSPGDGAVPGRYRVRVEPGPSSDRKPKKPPFPAKYLDEDSSHIVITVKDEPNSLDPIRLK
jgi:hypothetical protein